MMALFSLALCLLMCVLGAMDGEMWIVMVFGILFTVTAICCMTGGANDER